MKNYLIVGASSGIGLSVAEQLHNEGHNVIGTYFSCEELPPLAIQWQRLNVLEEQLNFDFLPDDLSGLVYCPGSIDLKPFKRIASQEFRDDLELQVVGAIKVIQSVLSNLKKSDSASIVLFSTVAVETGFNFHSKVAVSKGAIQGLTRALAAEFAPKIRVNAIAPSITDTKLAKRLLNTPEKIQANADRHPMKKIGMPTDIANAAVFLLSSKADWITGQIVNVDGGIAALRV